MDTCIITDKENVINALQDVKHVLEFLVINVYPALMDIYFIKTNALMINVQLKLLERKIQNSVMTVLIIVLDVHNHKFVISVIQDIFFIIKTAFKNALMVIMKIKILHNALNVLLIVEFV